MSYLTIAHYGMFIIDQNTNPMVK